MGPHSERVGCQTILGKNLAPVDASLDKRCGFSLQSCPFLSVA